MCRLSTFPLIRSGACAATWRINSAVRQAQGQVGLVSKSISLIWTIDITPQFLTEASVAGPREQSNARTCVDVIGARFVDPGSRTNCLHVVPVAPIPSALAVR